MNKVVKTGVVAAISALILPVFAQEAEVVPETPAEAPVEEGAIGWTPFAISLASPVQLPWGRGNWDVYGIDLGIFYNDINELGGVQVSLANTTQADTYGFVAGGAFNYTPKNVYGVRAALGGNICLGEFYGADFGGFGMKQNIWGLDAGFVGTWNQNVCGSLIALLVNFTEKESYGCTFAGGVNISKVAYGAQVAGVFNQTEELHGAQIGLVNFAREVPWGFQVGLVNIIMDNQVKVLPFVNGYF